MTRPARPFTAAYPGRCASTGESYTAGTLIRRAENGRYVLAGAPEPIASQATRGGHSYGEQGDDQGM